MAKLCFEKFYRCDKTRNTVHKIAAATYTAFEAKGEKYFQIDTYGTEERDMPEKVSQSMQFDKTMAEELICILKREFSIK
ncbi:hypothetical protein [uncultured Anaeromusa sp.]|uniref:hypothetical protein n=1 Tax=uncultured Anaeromusa sp. TaxID=673273 RepID=UPI0029C69DD1|nr:hypothetical protein [uncultured Anaeromusa sp.]